MYQRIINLPLAGKDSLFLFGPRGTGKTYWIKHVLKLDIYIDLLNESVYREFRDEPATLERRIPAKFTGWVVIDEIQKLPYLLNEVHRLIESKQIRFLLTGSSARSLRRQGVNLLAGRALLYHMHPLVAQELGDLFHLQHAIDYGLLPGVIDRPNPKEYLKAYVETYIREEVVQEGLVRSLKSFSHFLEVASFSQGQTLNIAEISRELQIDRDTVTNYFSILEDLLLSIRIPPFTQRAKRKMIVRDKFFFFDAGVFRAIRPMNIGDAPEEAEGAALETVFLQSLSALNDYLKLDYKIYFWATYAGQEVDFVIFGPKGFYAFEIKRSSRVDVRELRGLKLFKSDYPEATTYFIYRGTHRQYFDDITAIPFEEALRDLPRLIGADSK